MPSWDACQGLRWDALGAKVKPRQPSVDVDVDFVRLENRTRRLQNVNPMVGTWDGNVAHASFDGILVPFILIEGMKTAGTLGIDSRYLS